jgi:arylformamidase
MSEVETWRESAAKRESMGCREISYGASARQKLDIYPVSPADGSAGSNATVHFHVHGGAWRRLSKEDAAFIVPSQQAAGLVTVIPDFDLLPDVSLTQMFEQLVAAFEKCIEVIDQFGGDPARVVVSGHSSGAHLAALLAEQDWQARGLAPDVIKSLLAISGPFDLEPVLLSARREYVILDDEAALALNAYQHASNISCPVQLLHGEHESPEFIRQTVAMNHRLKTLGSRVTCNEIKAVNHFEIMSQLGDATSPVWQAMKRAIVHACVAG